MPRRVDLPPELRAAPFRVAHALNLGLSDTRLRGLDLVSPFHGVRSPAQITANLVSACAAYATKMRPEQFFSHETAARLWNFPMPRAYEDGDLLHVSARSRNHIPRSRGVIGHLISDPQVVVHNLLLGDASDHPGVQLGKVPVSDPVATFLGLAGVMHWKDLVAIGDYLVRIPVKQAGPLPARPFVTLPELRSRVASFRGRGKRRAAYAIALVREGADSRPETLLRLLIREAGLPAPELNMNVFDQHGRWIARVDMFYPEFGLIVEYDGDQHRTSTRQYERDAQRIEQLTAINCNVLRVRARGLWQDRAETAERIRKALLAAGWNREC